MTIEAPPRRHRLAVAVRVTVGLVAAAVVWLLVLLIVTGAGGYPIDGPFAPLARWLGAVLLVGWLASLTGVVLAFVARRRAGSAREAKRMLTTALALLPAALIGCIGLALLVLLWVGFSHPFADNPAADAGGRLSSELRSARRLRALHLRRPRPRPGQRAALVRRLDRGADRVDRRPARCVPP